MANLIRWGRSSPSSLRRDVEDLLDEFASPRALRREIDELLGEDLSPRAVRREMDRIFDEFDSPGGLRRKIERVFERLGGRERDMFVPEVELKEKDRAYELKVDLPGIRQEDVDVRVEDDNVLTISGERREEETKRVRGYDYSERTYGSFSRSVALPRNIDANRIEADFRDGVLMLTVPKSESAREARRIPVGGKEGPRVLPGHNGGREKEQAQRS